jgi:hypothetical protein
MLKYQNEWMVMEEGMVIKLYLNVLVSKFLIHLACPFYGLLYRKAAICKKEILNPTLKTMKKSGLFSFSIVIGVFLMLLFACEENKTERVDDTKEDVEKTDIFSKPFENIGVESTVWSIKPGKDTVLTYLTGSSIIIPKDAFLDKDGKPIKAEVELSYREFNNALEVWLEGIPMVYDSAGTSYVFETAGMIDINATMGGKDVYVNPDKKIEIRMSSFDPDPKYNLYSMDPANGVWTSIGKDKPVVEKESDYLASLPKIPPMPKKANDNSFSIGDYTGKYPELEMYKNVLFTPSNGKPCGFNASTEIKVVDLGNGTYRITFIFDGYGTRREQICDCYLAFKPGVDYDNALKAYQTKYKFQIEKRDKLRAEYELKMKYYNEVKQKYADLGLLDVFFRGEVNLLKGNDKIVRTFQLNGFGIKNVDCAMSYPQGTALTASYKDVSGNSVKLNNVVLVEKETNAIFPITDLVRFNPQKENLLFGVATDGKLAYMKPETFKKIEQTEGNYTFFMTVHPATLNTYEEICKVLFL